MADLIEFAFDKAPHPVNQVAADIMRLWVGDETFPGLTDDDGRSIFKSARDIYDLPQEPPNEDDMPCLFRHSQPLQSDQVDPDLGNTGYSTVLSFAVYAESVGDKGLGITDAFNNLTWRMVAALNTPPESQWPQSMQDEQALSGDAWEASASKAVFVMSTLSSGITQPRILPPRNGKWRFTQGTTIATQMVNNYKTIAGQAPIATHIYRIQIDVPVEIFYVD